MGPSAPRDTSVDVEEKRVSTTFLERIDGCALTVDDVKWLTMQEPVRPRAADDYIHPFEDDTLVLRNPWRNGQDSIPMKLIDVRIMDLAVTFWDDPDVALLKAFRRLEGIVRDRLCELGVEAHELAGQRLFSTAFNKDDAPLTWKGISHAERTGRANLFVGTFSVFRNACAHREENTSLRSPLTEFLTASLLYLLEDETIGRHQNSS